ncbi:MAG: ROK family protein [Rhodothermales bacterium]
MATPLLGAIEAGGTKFVCAIGTGPDDLHALERFPTTTPAETLQRAIAFFKQHDARIATLGIGSFGPIDPNPASPSYGHITTTPKAHWSHTDFAGKMQRALGCPVAFDTDVNAAARGEQRWGAAQDVGSALYITVGTGIGGGFISHGRTLHGLVHPEMGHIRVPRHPDDPFPGRCPYHRDCLEGLASGPALHDRWGQPGADLSDDHPAWPIEAHYLGHAVAMLALVLSPERVILGGGVMHQPQLLPLIRSTVHDVLAGYVQHASLLHDIDQYIVAPGLGDRAGVLGALALAQTALV